MLIYFIDKIFFMMKSSITKKCTVHNKFTVGIVMTKLNLTDMKSIEYQPNNTLNDT